MKRLSQWHWAIICFALNGLALWWVALPFADVWFSTDEGIYAYQAQRILEGQVMYRDFFQPITPGFFLLLAAWMKVVGAEVFSLRLLMILIVLATSLAIFFLTRRLGVTPFLSLFPSLAFSVLKSRTNFELNHYPPDLLLEVLAALAVCHFVVTRRPGALVAAGALASADILTTQNLGTHLVIGCLLALWADSHLGRRDLLRKGALFAAGAAPLPLAYLSYAYSVGALESMYRSGFVWVFKTYTRFDTQDYWFHWLRLTWSRLATHPSLRTAYDLALGAVESLGAPAAILIAILWLARRIRAGRALDESHQAIAATTAVAASMYAAVYAAPNSLLARVSLIGYVLAYALACRLYRHWRVQHPRLTLAAVVAPAGIVSMVCIAAVPLRTAKVFFNLLRQQGTTQMRHAITAHGPIRLPTRSDAGQFDLLRYLSTRLRPHDALFVANWSPWVYYLGDYRNPTKCDGLMPRFNSDEQVHEAIQTLDRLHVGWIVQDRILRRNIDRKDGRFQAVDEAFVERWEFTKYLRASFVEVARMGDYTVYRRRE